MQSTKRVRVNRPPKAYAGLDQKVNVGDRVVLSALNNSDPDGDKVTFSWKQVSPKKPRIHLEEDLARRIAFTVPDVGGLFFF